MAKLNNLNRTDAFSNHTSPEVSKYSHVIRFKRIKLLVGPPMLTISKGLGNTDNSSCQADAAVCNAIESA